MTGKTRRAHALLGDAAVVAEDGGALQAEVEMRAGAEPAETGPAETGDERVESEADWQRVLVRLRAELGEDVFNTWLKTLQFDGVADGVLSLKAPTPFVRDWIQRHYGDRIREHWSREVGAVAALAFTVESTLSRSPTPRRDGSDTAATDSFGGALDPGYTFENFVVGRSNELAYAASRRVAEGQDVAFNPIFLHGGVGLGKTHLMHAIAWEVKRRSPEKKVLYISAERFMFQFITALRYKDTVAFKQQFRSVDLLMVDDVHFIANKNTTQEEFFHTFNALVDNRRQVVITADKSPSDLEGIQERIISRLGWGLVADIHPTDYELRLGILQSKAERLPEVDVPMDVLEFLARRIASNVRELEGALNRVVAFATLVGRPINLDMTQEVLADLIRANDRQVTIDEIQRQVADFYNLRLSEMLSQRRSRNIVRPRQVAMHLAKKLTARSLPEIGRKFGGRDHTTVMHADRTIESLAQKDKALAEDLRLLIKLLRG